MRAAAGNHQAPDSRTAPEAGFSGPSVHLVSLLKPAGAAFGIDVTRNGRPAQCDGLRQDFANRLVERRRPPTAEARSDCGGVKSGASEALVGIDVSEAAQKTLVQQQALQPGASGMQSPAKLVAGDFHWIGAQPVQFVQVIPHQTKLPETPRVAEVQPAAGTIQAEDHMGMGPQRFRHVFKDQPAGHSQMN